ncbi:MAG: RcnB family protein [Hyphomonadaceae bacterium]
MKRFAMAALAAATFAAPLAISTDAAAQHRSDRHHGYDRNDRGHDRWDDRRGERHAYREGRRDQRRWDRRAYNGYNYRGRWYYGPPPQAYAPYATYGYRAWRRGDRLPRYYRDSYYVVRDYDRYRLRPPPRGYHYVRDDRGDYLLVGIATGVILSVILGG